MTNSKPAVGVAVSPTSFAHVDGGGREIGAGSDRWSILFVYRGKHCPRCKRYLNKLNEALADWTAKMDVIVVSADTKEKAQADRAEFGWTFDLCYGMTEPQMRTLGSTSPSRFLSRRQPVCLLNPEHLGFARMGHSCSWISPMARPRDPISKISWMG